MIRHALAFLSLALLLASAGAVPATGPSAGGQPPPCDSAAGKCCCVMANGLRCCGSATICPSSAISGCPCARPGATG
ncbi:hypothetical protein [Mangrovicoccus sp. HB161399]|uniref:hypothetical protein n=1 Tax=Mangrovicoccus sp. HB161399 TaxID=2720392 RepID=UPI001C131BD7|nr:hypothetical protein [Mangrovicoccus sp. HB161399]